MERLQIAIEKARANRQKAQGQAPAGAVAEADADVAVAADTEPPAAQDVVSNADAAWAALPELTLTPNILRRNLVVTAEAEPAAMPFDLLRTKIMQISRRHGWRKIAVVSAHAAAGKSTLCANLAFCFSRQTDLRTLVLDFDLRRPGLAPILGQKPPHSMPDVISGKVPFASQALRYRENIIFGLNRQGVKNASEILQSRATKLLLDEIEQAYQPDYMLFDTPPLLITDDALGFLNNVDAALIVAEAERTPIRQIDAVESQVAELTNVLGVVLNRCVYMDKDSGYSGDYY